MDRVPSQRPDSFGRFGQFGGKYVPETLMYALTQLEAAFHSLASDEEFQVFLLNFALKFAFFSHLINPTWAYQAIFPLLQSLTKHKMKSHIERLKDELEFDQKFVFFFI